MFKHAKSFRMYNVPSTDLQDFNETHECFTGWGSDFLHEKYGHLQFDSSKQFVEKTGFDWHNMVRQLVQKTEVNMIDAETFEIVAYYATESDWDKSNDLCLQHQISHGWQTFSTGIYAVLNK